jgi:hypothetical protein
MEKKLNLERPAPRGVVSKKERYSVLSAYAIALLSVANAIYLYRYGAGWRTAALSVLVGGIIALAGRAYHVEARKRADAAVAQSGGRTR